MSILYGTDITHRFSETDKDLYVPYEILNSLKQIPVFSDKFEYVGRIRRNEGRYEGIDEHTPVVEYYKGKGTDNIPLDDTNEDTMMSYYIPTLNFHTHPVHSDSMEESADDCSAFIGGRRSKGKTYFAIISNKNINIYDLSKVDYLKIVECSEGKYTDKCSCLYKNGMNKHSLSDTEDIILKRAFKEK